MAQITSEEWRLGTASKDGQTQGVFVGECFQIFVQDNAPLKYRDPKKVEAIARIIAAAPGMLKACEAVSSQLKEIQNSLAASCLPAVTRALIEQQIEKLDGAMAKARGQS